MEKNEEEFISFFHIMEKKNQNLLVVQEIIQVIKVEHQADLQYAGACLKSC